MTTRSRGRACLTTPDNLNKLPRATYSAENWHAPDVRHRIGKKDKMHLAGKFDVVFLEVLQEQFPELEAVFDGSICLRRA